METDRLKLFCSVVELGSLSKAAETCGLTVSGLSRSLKILQDELGLQLLKPEGRGVIVTDEGYRVFTKVKHILEQVSLLPVLRLWSVSCGAVSIINKPRAPMKFLIIFFCLMAVPAWSFDHGHSDFSKVLKSFVVRNGSQTLVNYKELKKSTDDLDKYIESLGKISIKEYESWSTDQKLAVLINGYNAWTLKLISQNYPVSSIKKIGPFYSTPWKMNFIRWLGDKVSLDDIEHGIIRKKFKEPRIHFALVCAAKACPSLQEVPFQSEKLGEQLEKAAMEFINDKNKNRAIVAGDAVTLEVSSIFNWYGGDFGTREELISYILRQMGLNGNNMQKATMRYLDYDWSLNELK